MMRKVCLVLLVSTCAACADLSQVLNTGAQVSQAAGYNPAQLSKGIKDALALSVTRASEQLSESGGYSERRYRIQLPDEVQQIEAVLAQFGLDSQINQVETLMNRGAEIAAAEAKTVFLQALADMSVDDAIGIVRGGDTAATEYFREQTQSSLRQRYETIMENQLEQLGFYRQYQQLLSAYTLLPIANKPDLDLEQAAINQGIAALFDQIAQEEVKIRENPVEQGSLLIASVFGN